MSTPSLSPGVDRSTPCGEPLRIGVTIGICVCLLSVAFSHRLVGGSTTTRPQPVDALEADSTEQDARLQSIAWSALGTREGTIVVIDPQTGRVRAVVNPGLAFQDAFPPGSTIKPFTALAALRAGVIDGNSRMRCREKYLREDVVDACSHPRNLPPLNPAEAISYSCNYYFAKIAERVKEDDLIRTLAGYGFGRATGINRAEESNGVLVRTGWHPENAIGEGRVLQVTPIQLLMAYAALLNGGRLWRPALAPAAEFSPHIRAQLQIEEAERAVLLEGMRGAVRFGTASEAGLNSLSWYVVGKTGTSTPLQGFRSQGWFVGLAFAPDTKADPVSAQLGVVVFLKNAHGAEAAEVARPILKEATGLSRGASRSLLPLNVELLATSVNLHGASPWYRLKSAFSQTPIDPRRANDAIYVRVHQVTENVTTRMLLEDYILRVVAVEGSVEDEPEALKALAIAARTYALKNLRRHGEQGYDFCSTTHCQRFALLPDEGEVRSAVVVAVKETNGLVVKDEHGQIAESYFGASCGGMTANMKTLWGTNAPKYLRGVRDDYCNLGAHFHWTDVIAEDRLATALRSDPRTDVGKTIRELFVARQDGTGRAERISILGERRRTISGWEFKLILGRSLGWNVLKSSRFTVSRSGSAFVFRGSGFGHGLGLCQEGAHVMAQKGFNSRQILAKYFPGTSVNPAPVVPPGIREIIANHHSTLANHSSSLRSSHFRVIYPQTIEAREAELVLSFLESNRSQLVRRLSAAGIEFRFPNLEIFFNETTGDFVGRTGMPWWAAAATSGNRIELQPLQLLKQRRILETTLRHELVHVAIDAMGGSQTPRWLSEGMALYVAAEGKLIQRGSELKPVSLEVLEQGLRLAKTAGETQTAYAAAYNVVRELIRVEGEKGVWRRIGERNYSIISPAPHPR